MSQVVKKLQSGGNSPKTYGHLWVDGIDYGNSEEVYNAFANHARSQGLNQGEFYDQWLTALRNGQDVKFGNGNTVNMRPEGMSEKRAGKRSGWTRFWDDTFDNRRNHFSDAIATARRFTYNAPKPKEEAPKEKDKFNTDRITLNYNPDPKNNKRQVWSTTHVDNALAEKRVADALAWMADPSKFNYEDNARIAAAYSRAKGKDGTGDPNAFAENIWNVLRNYEGLDFKDENVQTALDWLDAFGIGVGDSQSASAAGSSTGSGSGSGVDDGTITLPDGRKAKRGEDGNWIYIEDSAQEEQTPRAEILQNPNNPTLISYRTAMGMKRPDLAWGLSWNGQNYSVEDINRPENSSLLDRMRLVQDINERTDLSQSERLRQLQQYINIPDDFSAYADWNPEQTVEGLDLGAAFGGRSVSSAGVSEYAPTADGTRIFKYYNNGEAGSNAWGFRNPYYLVYDNTGNLKMIKSDQEADLVANAGVGNLQTPNFIKNILAKTRLNYYTYDSAQHDRGQLMKHPGEGDFQVIGENDNYQVVKDAQGKQYIYNKKSKVLTEADDARVARYMSRKDGGKIDFNKVNAFSKGGRVVKAQGGLSNWMWNNRNNFTNIPITTTQSTQAITTIPGIFNIATGGSDTSLVADAIKAQKADQLASDLEVMEDPFNINSQSLSRGYTKPQMSKPKVKTKTVTDEEWYGGDPNADSSTVWPSIIKGGLAALDYGVMAWGRKKVHDQLEKGLWDSLYKKTAPRLQGINTATPVEDAQVAQWQQEYSKGLKPVTSDAITNYAMNKDRQASILPQMNQAIRQQSAAALQRQQANQQIANQQAQLDAEAENDFRARLSSLRMSLAQNDASLTTQQAQSLQNLIREGRTKFEEDDSKYKELAYNANLQNITNTADRNWLNTVQSKYSDIWAAWQNEADKSKYGYDFNTWAQNTGRWNDTLEAAYNDNRAGLTRDTLGLYRKKINPGLAYMYRDREGVPARKSGGSLTVKQRNRYKNEPSEDIWINQNKAAHAAVAKFNDNIIKAFLKTLK